MSAPPPFPRPVPRRRRLSRPSPSSSPRRRRGPRGRARAPRARGRRVRPDPGRPRPRLRLPPDSCSSRSPTDPPGATSSTRSPRTSASSLSSTASLGRRPRPGRPHRGQSRSLRRASWPSAPAAPALRARDDGRRPPHRRVSHGLIQDVEEGYVHGLAFVVPPRLGWPLPVYELALMTARRAYDMNVELPVTIITPELAPLAAFGDQASQDVARLLAEQRRSPLIAGASCEVPDGRERRDRSRRATS